MCRLVLSDVCDTLIDLNSTYDYIKFLYTHNYGNKILGKILNNRSFNLFSYILNRIIGIDFQRKLTPLFFKGIKKSNFSNINKDFREFYISKRTKILDKIIDHKNKGDKVVLVSASINPPIDMLSNYLGIEHYSSILEENKEGKYTGKIKNDLLGNKESLLKTKKLNLKKYNNVVFYTDNLSDIGFIKAIQRLAKSYKFYLIIKHEKIRNKRTNLLHTNNIKNYEFIS